MKLILVLLAGAEALEASKRHKHGHRAALMMPSLESQQHAKMPTSQVPWMPMQPKLPPSPFTQLMARPAPPARAGKPFFDPLTLSMYSWWPMMSWWWWPMMWWWPTMMYWRARPSHSPPSLCPPQRVRADLPRRLPVQVVRVRRHVRVVVYEHVRLPLHVAVMRDRDRGLPLAHHPRRTRTRVPPPTPPHAHTHTTHTLTHCPLSLSLSLLAAAPVTRTGCSCVPLRARRW